MKHRCLIDFLTGISNWYWSDFPNHVWSKVMQSLIFIRASNIRFCSCFKLTTLKYLKIPTQPLRVPPSFLSFDFYSKRSKIYSFMNRDIGVQHVMGCYLWCCVYFRQTKQFYENIINKVISLIMSEHTHTKHDYSFWVRMQCGIDLR